MLIMKYKSFLFFTLACLLFFNCKAQLPKEYNGMPPLIKKLFKDFAFLNGGTFIAGVEMKYYKAQDQDSTLLLLNGTSLISINSFSIFNHEVTNLEYHDFIRWVKKNNPENELIYAFNKKKI